MPPLAAAGIPAIIAALGTAGGLANMGYQMAQGGPDKGPDPMIAAKQAQDAADKARLRGVVGQSTVDAQTRTSGGASPDFLANVATQQAGTPGLQGDALDMVKQLLAGGGG
jgi:hypothetical protein